MRKKRKKTKEKKRGKKISNVQNSMRYNKFILTWLRPECTNKQLKKVQKYYVPSYNIQNLNANY